jgi:hypothetical protein
MNRLARLRANCILTGSAFSSALTAVGACAILLGLAGCGGTRYMHAGQTYLDKREALAAVKAEHEDLIARTRVTADRVGGTLDFYIPSKESLMQRGFRAANPITSDGKDYLAETAAMLMRNMYDAVVKRGSFDRVTLHYSDGGHINPKPGERAVYFFRPGPDTAAWYFSSDAVTRRPLHFDTGKTERFEKVQFWLESLDVLAKMK